MAALSLPDVESSISRKSGQQQHPSHALHLGYVFGRSHAPTTSRGLLQRISATGAPSPVVAYGDGGHLSPRLCKTNSQRQCHVVHWVNLYNMAFESLWAAVQEFSKNKNCPRFDMNVSSRRCSRQGSKVASQIRAKLRSRLHQPTRTYTTASLLVTSSYGWYIFEVALLRVVFMFRALSQHALGSAEETRSCHLRLYLRLPTHIIRSTK